MMPINFVAHADKVADNPGQWMYDCHVADHITAGTTSLYRVHEK